MPPRPALSTEQLANRPRRRGLPTSTGCSGVIVLGRARLLRRPARRSPHGVQPDGLGYRRSSRKGKPATPGGGAVGRGGTAGAGFYTGRDRDRVEGDTNFLYVETADGSTVKVVTTGATRGSRSSRGGRMADLSKGSEPSSSRRKRERPGRGGRRSRLRGRPRAGGGAVPECCSRLASASGAG